MTVEHNYVDDVHNQTVIIGADDEDATDEGISYARFFKGTIHKCDIYNYTLSDEEIANWISE